MFSRSPAFSGFAVRDIDTTRAFYADTLGLVVEDDAMGFLVLRLGGGGSVLVYPKPDHEPAGFTVLNFPVDDIDGAVDELNARGVVTTIYNEGGEMPVDAKGVMRGNGPDIAWFTDPSGNVLAVIAGPGI